MSINIESKVSHNSVVSYKTLLRRVEYGGKKGRRAALRLAKLKVSRQPAAVKVSVKPEPKKEKAVTMTKLQAVAEFKELHLPNIPRNDEPALNEAWNNYTDVLCKNGRITTKQYDTWVTPKITVKDWLKAKDNS